MRRIQLRIFMVILVVTLCGFFVGFPGSKDLSSYIFGDLAGAADGMFPTKFDTLTPLSNRVIKLTTREAHTPSLMGELQRYRLTSPTDSSFSGLRPVRTGRSQSVLDLSGDWTRVQADVQSAVYLIFDREMQKGQTYTLTVSGRPDQKITFVYNEQEVVNGSVKTNQVGYLPRGPKYGYVGNYLGDAGMMEAAPSRFEIRNVETGEVVFSGSPSLRGEDPVLSGEKVFECDFSGLTKPGRYYLQVPGVGRSYTFRIGEEVFDGVFYATARALFYQRCGMALEPPYAEARWGHGPCHMHDGVIHKSHAQSPLYNGEKIGGAVPMPGGWHDAGDYGKYVPTAAVSLSYLFTAYELFPEKFPDGHFDLPESGNGVPDLLDETRWEVDWLKEMQAPDGGVYFKVTTTEWAKTMPEKDMDTRYIAPKTTHTTGLYAATLAMAYRNFLPFWPEYARECLERAEKAWAFLEAHPNVVPEKGFENPPGIGGGEYGDPEGDVDERAWAAAELYKATGKEKYSRAFEKYWPQHQPMWGWNTFRHHQQRASWAYATTKFPTKQAFADKYKEEFRRHVVHNLIPRTENSVYRCAYRGDVPEWIGWGAFAESPQYAWELIRASILLDKPAWLDYAKINLDPQLGNNPQAKSYITGIGHDYPMEPLHHPSTYDGAEEPVPGLPVFGPHSYLSSGNPFFDTAKDNFFPAGRSVTDPYPVLRRYLDIQELVPMSEFTIQEIALNTATYAFFSSFDVPPRDGSTSSAEDSSAMGSGSDEGDAGGGLADGGAVGNGDSTDTFAQGDTLSSIDSVRADFDRDGTVSFKDFVLLAWAYGRGDPWFDLDKNGEIGFGDFVIFARMHGTPAAEESAAVTSQPQPGAARPASKMAFGRYALEQNYPNPFNLNTKISYRLPEAGRVSLIVYNQLGQEVRVLVREQKEAGFYRTNWDGKDAYSQDVSSGVYFYQLVSREEVQTRRMLLLK